MITALHTLIYAEGAEAARAFFRDVLDFPNLDEGDGWLIFKTGPSELGVHPKSWEYQGETGSTEQKFDLSLICDDLESTVADLKVKGAQFVGKVSEEDWGTTARLIVPGAGEMILYEPKYHPPATSL